MFRELNEAGIGIIVRDLARCYIFFYFLFLLLFFFSFVSFSLTACTGGLGFLGFVAQLLSCQYAISLIGVAIFAFLSFSFFFFIQTYTHA